MPAYCAGRLCTMLALASHACTASLTPSCTCRGCPIHPAESFRNGFFPATPTSYSISVRRPHCPVWVCRSLLDRDEKTQYHAKSSASDFALANALAASHRSCAPHEGQHGFITVVHLNDSKMRRYLSVALRELRYLKASLHQTVDAHAHPLGRSGRLFRQCAICSEGLDPDKALEVPADPKHNRAVAEPLLFNESIQHRPAKVRAPRAIPMRRRDLAVFSMSAALAITTQRRAACSAHYMLESRSAAPSKVRECAAAALRHCAAEASLSAAA